MSGTNSTIPQSDNRIVRISRDHYEEIVSERDAFRRENASLRALIQADGTLSKTVLGLGELIRAMATGLDKLSGV